MEPELLDRVLAAQTDEAELSRLIEEHKKFILANAYKAAGHFVTESDDEWSVALIAFHEAVRTFDAEKGDFRAFAALVIKRRVLDHLKSERRHAGEIPVAPETMDGDVQDDTADTAMGLQIRQREAELSEEKSSDAPGQNAIKDEIEALSEALSPYGISFFDLPDCSPKAEKTKSACAKAVAALLSDHDLLTKLRQSKNLPMKEITQITGIPRKILERHRKYIIAAVEILNGEYPLLAEYMSFIRKALIT